MNSVRGGAPSLKKTRPDQPFDQLFDKSQTTVNVLLSQAHSFHPSGVKLSTAAPLTPRPMPSPRTVFTLHLGQTSVVLKRLAQDDQTDEVAQATLFAVEVNENLIDTRSVGDFEFTS